MAEEEGATGVPEEEGVTGAAEETGVTGVPEEEKVNDPRYAPPYPQEFHKYWPRHFVKGLLVAGGVVLIAMTLAFFFRVPVDFNMALPDEGMYVPSPEWYFFLLLQPFWYLTGDSVKWLSLGTFFIPALVLTFLVLVPFIFKKGGRLADRGGVWKGVNIALSVLVYGIFVYSLYRADFSTLGEDGETSGTIAVVAALILLAAVFVVPQAIRLKKGVLKWALAVSLPVGIFCLLLQGIYASGYAAKGNGCIACHTPAYGLRQYLPPMDVGEYYRVERQRQIDVGKFRAGKVDTEGQAAIGGAAQSYKDANWQLRHYYEPTFTW
ncbi:MAG: hypothetical protein V3W31_05005 [Thermodesulfobacteriota bacterium]